MNTGAFSYFEIHYAFIICQSYKMKRNIGNYKIAKPNFKFRQYIFDASQNSCAINSFYKTGQLMRPF